MFGSENYIWEMAIYLADCKLSGLLTQTRGRGAAREVGMLGLGGPTPTSLREQKSPRISTTLFSEFLSFEIFFQSFFLNIFF